MTKNDEGPTTVLRKMVDCTADGLLVTDTDGKVVEYNRQFLDLFRVDGDWRGRTTRDLVAAISYRLNSPETVEAVFRNPAGETGRRRTISFTDGRTIEGRVSGFPLPQGAEGRIWSFREAPAAKSRLGEFSEEWLRVTLTSIGDAVITTDTAAQITYLNPVAEKMTGWTTVEARGQPLTTVFRIINELTRAEAMNPVARVLQEGTVIGLANHSALIDRGGREIAIEDSAAPIRDAAGTLVGTVMVFHDVAVRRKAEMALQRSEKLLADFFDNAPVGLNWIGPDGRVLRANRHELQLLGCHEAEYIGQPWENFHVDPAEAAEILATLLGGGSVENRTARLRRKDGAIREVIISANAFLESGRFVHARCFTRDVTEQNRAEAARAHLAALVASSDDAIISKSLQGVIQSWNAGAQRVFGYTAEEAIGQPITLVIPPDRLAEEPDILERLKRGERVDHFETVRRRKDGTLRDISLTISPVYDATGKIIGASKIARDITERKRAERELRDEHVITEQLNIVAQALATELDLAGIVQTITDAGTRITRAQFGAFFYNLVDEKGESYTLYTLSGVDRSAFDKFPMPRATALFGPTFRGEGVIRLDDVRKDPRFGHNAPHHGMPRGHLPVVSYLAVPVVSRSGEVIGGLFFGHPQPGVFTARDEKIIVAVAAQAAAAMDTARLYEAEKKARAAAEKASETKDRFIATLSHELRTPLTPVLAILSSLRENAGLTPSIAADLETARRNVLLEARLIDDLLDLTRISRGKLSLEEEVIFVEGLIETAFNTCRPDLEARELEFVRDLRASSAAVMGDSARLIQVLWNLLKNAIKFTPDGGTITIRSRIRNTDSGGDVVIEIQDTGLGIDAETMPRIFSAFEQGSQETTRRFGGLGLGLAISRAIVQAHHGTLEASSGGRNQGSTFTLILPLVRRQLGTGLPLRDSAATNPGSPKAATPALRILLVEDHADTAKVLKQLLGFWGHSVLLAGSVGEAVGLADKEMARRGLDLVISDLGLPDASGLDLMRELSRKYSLTGIALSGYGMETDVKESADAGFARHLTKPVDINLLRAAVHEIATKARSP